LKWWEMRENYQGLKAPIERKAAGMDIGQKIHIAYNVPYIRYFFAFVMQYSVHKKACTDAGEYPNKPMDQCDIYGSKKAGKNLRAMMELGKSKPWPEALKTLIGSDKMSTDAMKEYFQPLIEWLKKQRAQHKYKIGWTASKNPLKPKGAKGSEWYLKGNTVKPVCMTTKSKECKFPFKYKGTTYSSCTTKGSILWKAWCSTSTNDDGSYNGKWGYCDMGKCTKDNKAQ